MSWEAMRTRIMVVRDLAERMDAAALREDPLAVAKLLSKLPEEFSAIGAEVVGAAIMEGHSQKKIAAALDVPPSTLRGARAEFLGDEG